ncbi:MAG: hypothetical protein HZC36_07250 [Armatimonadetes bacterium]|nr:hypothetical protein [Armatimonadota bacterium]
MSRTSGDRIEMATLVQALVCLALLWFWLLPRHHLDGNAFKIPALICIAGLAFINLLHAIFKVVRLGPKAWLPGSIVAPVLHVVLMALVAMLGTTSPVAIQRPADPLVPANLWLDPAILGQLAALESLALALAGTWANRGTKPKGEDR